jgi:hypothetical protein
MAFRYLRELLDVLRARGNLVPTPDGDHIYAREVQWDDLTSPPTFDPLREALTAANLVRCSSEQGIEALVNSWLSGWASPRSIRGVISRWFQGITAAMWEEYQAVGFENLRVDRTMRLSDTVTLVPSSQFRRPSVGGPNLSVDEIQTFQVKTWAVSRIKATSRFPMSTIKHFPFPHALEQVLAIYLTPLLKWDYQVAWDGPFQIRKPIYLPQPEDRIGVAVIDQKIGRAVRDAYSDATKRFGQDFWAGTRGFRDKPERVSTAVNYLAQAGRDPNVFTSHITLATCMEALLAPRNGQELRHRVSERAAVLAGVDDEDVYDVWRHVKSLYDLRSTELHTGQVLERQARDIRKGMQPSLPSGARPRDGAAFLAPLQVSLEIARRAIAAALNIERARRPETFDPDKLDRAILRNEVRAELRSLCRGRVGSVPIRRYVAELQRQDGVRFGGVDSEVD